MPDSDGLDPAVDKMTIAAWVQPHSSQIGPLVKKINKIRGYRVNITGTGALRFGFRRNGRDKTVTSTTTLPLHEWTHVAARYDGAQMRIFINGTIDTATAAVTGTSVGTTAPVWIGGEQNHFHGYLDDISIYDRALSDSEIADLVNDVDKRYEYHHVNALGSNIVSTDDDQNVLARYEYDVFGAIRSETGTSDNTRKFTGKEFDADSNLYYYGARYYDPYIGRFTQQDPIGDGVNWYAYVANNPLRFVDPTGLRGVTAEEQAALDYTYGSIVGGHLGQRINIEFPDNFTKAGRVPRYTLDGKRNLYEIHLHEDYDETNLFWLGIFIHEATHVWQKNTGRYRGGEDYDYDVSQLDSLDLKREEHAQAVQDWFTASYGVSKNLIAVPADGWISGGIDSNTNKPIWENVWENTLGRAGASSTGSASQNIRIINMRYNSVLQELRRTDYLSTDQFR